MVNSRQLLFFWVGSLLIPPSVHSLCECVGSWIEKVNCARLRIGPHALRRKERVRVAGLKA